jgi:hypothetical protein
MGALTDFVNIRYFGQLWSREEVMGLMRRHVVHYLPILDDQGRLVDLATLGDLIGAVRRPNWVVLMAGGMGTRLCPLTESCPKPMLPIGGKPILEIILESFLEQGFRRFFLAVNYRAEMVRDYFGDGERWGARIEYLEEKSAWERRGPFPCFPVCLGIPSSS